MYGHFRLASDGENWQSFEGVFLKREYLVNRALRPADVAALQARLGELGPDDVFIPATCPHLAPDPPDLSTYHKGNAWAFAIHLAECHGLGKGGAVDALPLHLRQDDDYELWRVALEHILSELPLTPGVSARIGRCSHWHRPHQTRWKADGGFAWPTGYGSGTGGFSRDALPQFDWSVIIQWTGQRWEPAKNKSVMPAVRVTIPSRTGWHRQSAIHTIWTTGKEKEIRFYGFRDKGNGWHCTAETEWDQERAPKGRKKRLGSRRTDHS